VADVHLAPASTLSQRELAALFTAGYQDYLVPIEIDEHGLAAMVRNLDLDLDASRIAVRGGEPVGVCMLGLRGAEAWIGGLGVVVAERRAGIGRRLMQAVLDEAAARGVREVRLEVIVENERAIALYEDLGFERTRGLEVWSLAGAPGPVRETDAAAAHAWVREHRTHREPWQRDDATLAHLDDLRGLEADGGAAVVRAADGRVTVQQLAGDEAALRSLLAAARALGDSVSVLNLPEGHPAGPVLIELGGAVAVRQHELVLVRSS
jgi:ribosomal protein S18 acetylase RimI-like enzyme